MNLETLFKQQSKRDLQSAYILHEKEDYGNAAFLSQQAIEKAFKYVLMKYELIGRDTQCLKNVSHKPVVELLNQLKIYNNKFEPKNDADKIIKTANEQLMPYLENIFKEMHKSTILDEEVWWKISLGIELPVDETKKILYDIKKYLDNLIKILQKIKNKILEINNGINSHLIREMDKVHDSLKKYRDELKDSTDDNMPDFLKRSQQEIDNLQNLSVSLRKNKCKDKKTIGKVILGIWVITYNITLLKITAHEQRGRYPENIDDKSSLFIYKNHKENLKNLINDTKKATIALYSL